jgi:hypothetical protein
MTVLKSLIRGKPAPDEFATATAATVATVRGQSGGSVAAVATVAVATPQNRGATAALPSEREALATATAATVATDRQPEPESVTDIEARLREIARAHNLDWAEARRWMRDIDVLAAAEYLSSPDPRDREGVVTWLKVLSDRSIPKMPVEWLDEMQRRPN